MRLALASFFRGVGAARANPEALPAWARRVKAGRLLDPRWTARDEWVPDALGGSQSVFEGPTRVTLVGADAVRRAVPVLDVAALRAALGGAVALAEAAWGWRLPALVLGFSKSSGGRLASAVQVFDGARGTPFEPRAVLVGVELLARRTEAALAGVLLHELAHLYRNERWFRVGGPSHDVRFRRALALVWPEGAHVDCAHMVVRDDPARVAAMAAARGFRYAPAEGHVALSHGPSGERVTWVARNGAEDSLTLHAENLADLALRFPAGTLGRVRLAYRPDPGTERVPELARLRTLRALLDFYVEVFAHKAGPVREALRVHAQARAG